MDPYVTLEFKDQCEKTKVNHMGSKTPIWNETFKFYISSESAQGSLKLTCFDDDLVMNVVTGEATLPVYRLCCNTQTKEMVPIYYEGERTGELFIETKFTPFQSQ